MIGLFLVVGCFWTFQCAAAIPSEYCIYDPDPKHLWNRMHEILFIRTSVQGDRYGFDRVDPLYWVNTNHLLEKTSHQRALDILTEFLETHGEKLIQDPLKRAWLQHDLWALFDWAALINRDQPWYREERFVAERRRLAELLAPA